MSDESKLTVEEITARIPRFRDERDWKQFHNPKDLAVAISLEASELLEHFLWVDTREAELRSQQRLAEIQDEIADIGIYVFELADNLGIDLLQAIADKLHRNADRYPADKAKGRADKYKEL